MDFAFTEEQDATGELATQILTDLATHEALRALERGDGPRFDRGLWTKLAEAGLIFSGVNPELDLVEMVELADHPHFVGCQFHPEFKSKPFAPHPLFAGFVRAAVAQRDSK